VKAHSVGAICPGPTGNIQGLYKFLNLRTRNGLRPDAGHLYQCPEKSLTESLSLAKPIVNPNSLRYMTVGAISSVNPRPQECQTLSTLPFLKTTDSGDLNPPTVNQDYGLDEGQDINLPLAKTETVYEPEFPNENPIETLEDINHLQNHDEHLKPDPPQPPEQIDREVPDPGVNPPRCSQRARTNPERLIPSCAGGKSYESIAGVNTHLVHPEAHMDPS
jgi:hypothetical protein